MEQTHQPKPEEYQRFTNMVDRLLSVPQRDFQKALKEKSGLKKPRKMPAGNSGQEPSHP